MTFNLKFLNNKNEEIIKDIHDIYRISKNCNILLTNENSSEYYFQINKFKPQKLNSYSTINIENYIKYSGDYNIVFYNSKIITKYHNCDDFLCLSEDGSSNYCNEHNTITKIYSELDKNKDPIKIISLTVIIE